ncbi:calpain-2 catalytic subunit-like [Colossoma macropomum]|uniref:calpain-2 catalytic subunit-like n=1 Tax=Colossoma macropomum TaxID=42526 RepID=UPI0018654391|nr:calpain-2 catalytic subunit-like [Colossoma macropomum]
MGGVLCSDMGGTNNQTTITDLKQDFEALRKECLKQGVLFCDPTFPAGPKSLGFSELGPSSTKAFGVEWKRPKDLCSSPQFIIDGATRTDICQGELGDCWLMAAIASLTLDKDILARVIHPEQNFTDNYAGIFHFQLWQYGKWVDVVIDDLLPTRKGQLLFVHSVEKNEFWSPLLEKAYAKVNGSYEALSGGLATEGFVDFTGGISECYKLSKAPPNLFSIMKKALSRGSLLSSSISPSSANEKEAKTKEHLVTTHAYSITGAEEVHVGESRVELVRLRNPWGHMEWNGAWSDDSKEWDHVLPEEKSKLDHSADDGEFWMAFSDFVQRYSVVEICNLTPDASSSDEVGQWNLYQFEGSWKVGSTAGGCSNHPATFSLNPQFPIKLEHVDHSDQDGGQNCSVLVGLMQKGGRKERELGHDYNFIGFVIYKVPDEHKGRTDVHLSPDDLWRLSPVARSSFVNAREVCERFKLPLGEYVIIPSTYEPNHEGSFLLRVFSDK